MTGVRNTLQKTDILRGFKAFADVVRNGVRVRSGCLLCHVVMLQRSADTKSNNRSAGVKTGFAVPKKRVPRAVDRNRIKRLMREAYRMKATILRVAADEYTRDLRIVLVYQQRSSPVSHGASLRSLQEDWNEIAAKILASME
ncbi:MAG: ribonuclease P protein component [Ignavibacteriales bacterium]|nr:ribonuclease P protein component [Ignavibacteriales bacterium]